MSESTHIILDPTAHLHRTGRVWQVHQREWLRRMAPVELSVAESAAEAEELAHGAAMKGFRRIIAVGGSRVAHGLVNGLMRLAWSHRKELRVGFLSIIRPDEWSRTIDFPHRLERQVEVLLAGHTMPFDVGRVTCRGEGAEQVTRYFLNGAGFGVRPQMRHAVASGAGTVGRVAFRVGRALEGLWRERGLRVRIEGDGAVLYEGASPMGMVMGGRYYPALGELAPDASPTDGALDPVWVRQGNMATFLAQAVAMALPGGNGPSLGAERARCHEVAISALNGPVYLEADGVPLGRLPATFSVEPRAISVIVPQVGARLKKAVFAPLPTARDGRLAGYSRGWQHGARRGARRAGHGGHAPAHRAGA